MLKRLFPSRWARIIAWTGAAVAWGTSVVTVQAAMEDAAVESQPASEPEPEVIEVPAPVAVIPAPPEEGLVVIRYSPVPPPPPEVITRTVTVAGGGGGGGATTTNGSSGGTTDRPTINVVSSGS